MFGLEYIAAGYLQLASAQVKCELTKAPEITVSATGLETKIIETRGIRDLSMMSPQTDTPYEKDAEVHTEGLRLGRMGVSASYLYETMTYPQINKVCMFVSKVTINIKLDPTIYIAKEFKRGTCHYKAVLEHEKKHVALDRVIVNKYTNIMVRAVDNTLKHAGYAHGPYRTDQLPALQKQISGIIDSVIDQFSKNMNAENNALQKSTVDTLAEYERVDAMCPEDDEIARKALGYSR